MRTTHQSTAHRRSAAAKRRPHALLACNAGSSSLKVEAWVGTPWRSLARASVAGIGGPRTTLEIEGREPETLTGVRDQPAAARRLLEHLGEIGLDARALVAVGHRVVHGGARFTTPVRVTTAVRRRLDALTPLAPLHNPAALAVIDAVRVHAPRAPAIAVFDTAFFHDLPVAARTYALPERWNDGREPLRRYGFHGLAHEYMAQRFAATRGARARRARVLSLQLGQGCSIAALAGGRPVETSMGFTPLEGLVMGTRPGDVDAGILLQRLAAGDSAATLDAELNHASGLMGLAGSNDVRSLLAREARGDAAAALALAVFVHRIVKYAGAYAAVLGGVDAVLFGGGIGEHAAPIRARVCAGLAWLGLKLDRQANARCAGREGVISTRDSAIEVHVVPVHEERSIARAACAALGISASGIED
jgi:acetate kinase